MELIDIWSILVVVQLSATHSIVVAVVKQHYEVTL
jgi:hypothetical protein